MQKLTDLIIFLNELERNKIYYELGKIRNNSIMIIVAVPGQRWEIEFMADGTIEIEKFCSNGEIFNENEIETLFQNYSD